MKSGFTRTGKRTLGGAVDDGVKAVSRYWINNLSDGHKQDAIDLFTGARACVWTPERGGSAATGISSAGRGVRRGAGESAPACKAKRV